MLILQNIAKRKIFLLKKLTDDLLTINHVIPM